MYVTMNRCGQLHKHTVQ